MKLHTIKLLLITVLVITAQPAHGMYVSFKKNTYVKYGATALAGFTLGASLMYYLTRPTKTSTKGSELTPVSLSFKTNKFLTAFCSQEDLNTLTTAKTCYVKAIDEQKLEIQCGQQELTFYSNKCLMAPTKNDKALPVKFDMNFYHYEWAPLIEQVLDITLNTCSNKVTVCFKKQPLILQDDDF